MQSRQKYTLKRLLNRPFLCYFSPIKAGVAVWREIWPPDKVNNMVALSAEHREMGRYPRLIMGETEHQALVMIPRQVRDDVIRKDRQAAE